MLCRPDFLLFLKLPRHHVEVLVPYNHTPYHPVCVPQISFLIGVLGLLATEFVVLKVSGRLRLAGSG